MNDFKVYAVVERDCECDTVLALFANERDAEDLVGKLKEYPNRYERVEVVPYTVRTHPMPNQILYRVWLYPDGTEFRRDSCFVMDPGGESSWESYFDGVIGACGGSMQGYEEARQLALAQLEKSKENGAADYRRCD